MKNDMNSIKASPKTVAMCSIGAFCCALAFCTIAACTSHKTGDVKKDGLEDLQMVYPPPANGMRCTVAINTALERMSMSCIADPSATTVTK